MSSPLSSTVEDCCLITGGAGNLARPITWALEKYFKKLVLTDIQPVPPASLPAHAVYHQMDVGDFAALGQLLGSYRPNAIIHLASLLSGSSEKDRRKSWHINTGATLEILEQALGIPDCRVLFTSTLATYGGVLPKVIAEDQSQWPTTLYGVSKVACERLGAYTRAAHGLDFRCARLPVVLSPQAPPQAVSAIVSRAFIESGESGSFVFSAAAETRIASLYVKDAIKGLVALLQAPREKITQPVYNVAGFTATLAEVSAAILKRLPEVKHRFEPDPEVEKVLSQWPGDLDDSNARRDWNWRPAYGLQATAADFLEGHLSKS